MISDRALLLSKGRYPSHAKLDALDKGASKETHPSIAQGMDSRGAWTIEKDPYGTRIVKWPGYENPVPLGPHVLVSSGPNGEDDGSEAVYWAKPLYCETNDSDWTAPFDPGVEISGSAIVPVTCLEELNQVGLMDQHSMPVDGSTPVNVYGMYDQTVIDGTSFMTMRRFFNRGFQSQPWFAEVIDGSEAYDGTPIDGSSPVYVVSEDEVDNTDGDPVTTMSIKSTGKLNYPVTNMSEDADSHELVAGDKFPVWSMMDKETPPKRRYFCFRPVVTTVTPILLSLTEITTGSQTHANSTMERTVGGIGVTWEKRYLWAFPDILLAKEIVGFNFSYLSLYGYMLWDTTSNPTFPPDIWDGPAAISAYASLINEEWTPATVTWANQPDITGIGSLPVISADVAGSSSTMLDVGEYTLSFSGHGKAVDFITTEDKLPVADGETPYYGLELRVVMSSYWGGIRGCKEDYSSLVWAFGDDVYVYANQ